MITVITDLWRSNWQKLNITGTECKLEQPTALVLPTFFGILLSLLLLWELLSGESVIKNKNESHWFHSLSLTTQNIQGTEMRAALDFQVWVHFWLYCLPVWSWPWVCVMHLGTFQSTSWVFNVFPCFSSLCKGVTLNTRWTGAMFYLYVCCIMEYLAETALPEGEPRTH